MELTTELSMLLWVTGLTLLMWVPYIGVRLLTHGMIPALTYKTDHLPVADWAERAKKAHYNAIENLIPFAVVVFIASHMGATNGATAAAATAYFWFRAAHYVLYVMNVPFGRTLTFAGGWFATACIFYQIVV